MLFGTLGASEEATAESQGKWGAIKGGQDFECSLI